MNRRSLIALALAAALAPAAALAQSEYPDRPITMVVPFPPGGVADITARPVAAAMTQHLKQTVVVENKAGAGGVLGVDVAAKASDGHTFAVGFNGPIAFGPFMYKKMPYDPAKDLAPIVLTTSQPNVLAVAASNPAKTLPEFVAWAKAQGKEKLSYGSVGNGSSSHLTAELFAGMAGFGAVHVPYAGSPPAATSLAAGETQMLFTVEPALKPLIQGGRIKLLASTAAKRIESLKDLPTVAETYPGFEAIAWNGLFGPASTPAAVVAKMNADVNAALKDPAVLDTFAKAGLIAGGGSPAEFKSFIDAEGRKWGAIIKKAGITLD